jgi:hypothetical protein
MKQKKKGNRSMEKYILKRWKNQSSSDKDILTFMLLVDFRKSAKGS